MRLKPLILIILLTLLTGCTERTQKEEKLLRVEVSNVPVGSVIEGDFYETSFYTDVKETHQNLKIFTPPGFMEMEIRPESHINVVLEGELATKAVITVYLDGKILAPGEDVTVKVSDRAFETGISFSLSEDGKTEPSIPAIHQ